jgi:hypothetical protein
MGAIEDIAAERRRQEEVEGWTPEHDDRHRLGEMALAAALYATSACAASRIIGSGLMTEERVNAIHPSSPPSRDWPWHLSWWKPKDRRRDLVRAGALIVAEIERLDRAAGHG